MTFINNFYGSDATTRMTKTGATIPIEGSPQKSTQVLFRRERKREKEREREEEREREKRKSVFCKRPADNEGVWFFFFSLLRGIFFRSVPIVSFLPFIAECFRIKLVNRD